MPGEVKRLRPLAVVDRSFTFEIAADLGLPIKLRPWPRPLADKENTVRDAARPAKGSASSQGGTMEESESREGL